MDQPDLDVASRRRALAGLRRLNWASGSARIFWRAIRSLARETGAPALRILDIASGGGDVPIALWQWGRRAGLQLDVVGCDFSRAAVDYARQRAEEARAGVRFQTCDVLGQPLPSEFHVVTSSLFLHHLSDAEAEMLLRKMSAAAQQMLLIQDLRRCAAGYLLAQAACRLLTASPVVRADGPQSVAGAFTVSEAAGLCRRAGLHGAQVERRWPFRFLLTWKRRRGERAAIS